MSEIDINKETNRRFVEEALNPANFDLVDELFTEDVSVRSGRGMGPVKRISHVEARPHKVLSFCW